MERMEINYIVHNGMVYKHTYRKSDFDMMLDIARRFQENELNSYKPILGSEKQKAGHRS